MLRPCVVFDLDGTLADTSGDLLAAANACFHTLGLGDVLGPDDAGTALRGGKAMLTLGLNRVGWTDMTEVDRQYPHLLATYDDQIDHHTWLYPGAMESIQTLKSTGYVVSICTNKPYGLANKLLTSLGVLSDFDALIGADSLPTRKPDPAPFWAAVHQSGGDPKRACLIGDSVTDRDTAQNAGVPSVLVTFGPAGGDMAALSPDALLSDYADLPQLITTIL